MKANTYERQKIYAEVWEEPMRVVAQRYGISDVMLKKICVKLNIPTPPRGYWAKAKTGDAPKPSKLPKSKGETVVYGNGSDDIESVADAGVKTLASLGKRAEERNYRERVISAQKTVDLFNDEVEKLNKALDEARRFEDAALLRRYAVEVVEHSVDLAEYASWLVEKANWIDPLTATEDPVFGDYELLGGMPEKKPNVNDALPYELKWYFDRQGYSENQTWEWFRQSVEKDRY